MKRILIAAVALGLAACSEPTGIQVRGGATTTTTTTAGASTAVQNVTLAPNTLILDIGATSTLSAALTASNGSPVTGVNVTFSSSNEAVATVSPAGVVTARGAGSATITATAQGKSALAAVTVNAQASPVASVAVTAPSTSICVGQSAQLTTTIRSVTGAAINGAAVAFRSSNNAVATVTATGLVTAVTPGVATITAVSGGASGSVTFNVCLR